MGFLHMQTKQLSVTIQKSSDPAFDGTFIMSAATPDRVNDTIDPAAYKSVEASTKELIALFNHDATKIVGVWKDIKAVGDTLQGKLKIAGTNLGKMLKQLIADDVPMSASIGFRGQGERNKKGGVHFKSIELMECSIVAIPCNQRAVQIAKQFNLEEFIDDGQSSAGIDDQPASGLHSEEIRTRAKAAIIAANRNLKHRR